MQIVMSVRSDDEAIDVHNVHVDKQHNVNVIHALMTGPLSISWFLVRLN